MPMLGLAKLEPVALQLLKQGRGGVSGSVSQQLRCCCAKQVAVLSVYLDHFHALGRRGQLEQRLDDTRGVMAQHNISDLKEWRHHEGEVSSCKALAHTHSLAYLSSDHAEELSHQLCPLLCWHLLLASLLPEPLLLK